MCVISTGQKINVDTGPPLHPFFSFSLYTFVCACDCMDTKSYMHDLKVAYLKGGG